MRYGLRRRPVADAPRLTIRNRISWPLKAVLAALLLALAAAIGVWAYQMGRDFSGLDPQALNRQVAALTEQIRSLQLERDGLRSSADAAESTISIERSAQQQLVAQIKMLEAENAKLKEDLAFFESMLPRGTGPKDVAIQRLEGELEAPNRLRYRLLVRQGVSGRNFSGSLQLALTVVQHGVSTVLLFPQNDAAEADKYKLEFKYYQRMEGVLTLPEGTVIKSVQARVLEKGKVRAQQSINM